MKTHIVLCRQQLKLNTNTKQHQTSRDRCSIYKTHIIERVRDALCLSVASIVEYIECNLPLLVTSASDLPLHTKWGC